MDLARAVEPRPLARIRLAVDAVGTIVLLLLLKANSWIQYQAPAPLAAQIGEGARWTNFGIRCALVAIGIIIVVHGYQESRRAFEHAPSSPSR